MRTAAVVGAAGLLMVSMAGPLRAQEPALGANPWVEEAEAFVRQLARGAYDSAAAKMAPGPARDALPAAKLREVWEQLGAHVGSLSGLVPARAASQDTMQLVELTAKFERQELLVRLVFTPQRQVAGLWFLPVSALAARPAEEIVGAGSPL